MSTKITIHDELINDFSPWILRSVWSFDQTLSFAMITIWSIVCLSFLLKDGNETLRQKSGKHNNWINLLMAANEYRGKKKGRSDPFPLCSSPPLVIFRPWRDIPGGLLFLHFPYLARRKEGAGKRPTPPWQLLLTRGGVVPWVRKNVYFLFLLSFSC